MDGVLLLDDVQPAIVAQLTGDLNRGPDLPRWSFSGVRDNSGASPVGSDLFCTLVVAEQGYVVAGVRHSAHRRFCDVRISRTARSRWRVAWSWTRPSDPTIVRVTGMCWHASRMTSAPTRSRTLASDS
jgi:hypothetical protein